MKTVSEVKAEDCLGCSACYAVCPEQAISMEESKKGFLVSKVEKTKCIDCGLCSKVCPVEHPYVPERGVGDVYAVTYKNDAIRMDSTSGGAFTALAQVQIESNGVVYGAVSSADDVFHRRVDDGNISPLRGSKYVQSDLRNSFSRIKADLDAHRPVLFVGTPCQCDGLNRYLKIKKTDTEGLTVIDFICHGTPSRRIYRDYITYCEKKQNQKIVSHLFRSKEKGWHNHLEANKFSDGTIDCSSFHSQLFKSVFYSSFAFKDSCYKCNYAQCERCADITIGDFWGIEKCSPEMDDNKGVSFVLLNTGKGTRLFDLAKPNPELFTEQKNHY